MIDENNTEEVKVLFDALIEYHCLFIDEVQFFSAQFLELILDHAYNAECDVLASGLTFDFLHNMFPAAYVLHETATVVELVEPCEICELDDALFNVRVDSKGHLMEQGGQIGVEGELYTYKSVCCGCKEDLRR
jgi:thymidine kinase